MPRDRLDPRLRDLLPEIAEGKKSQEIADGHHFAKTTVDDYIKKIREFFANKGEPELQKDSGLSPRTALIIVCRRYLAMEDSQRDSHARGGRQKLYLPGDSYLPKDRYLDEQWYKNQLDEIMDLTTNGGMRLAQQRTSELVGDLDLFLKSSAVPVSKRGMLENYQLKLTIAQLDIDADCRVLNNILQRARDLQQRVEELKDDQTKYDYSVLMRNLANKNGNHEEAMWHTRRALTLADSLDDPDPARLDQESWIVYILALTDPMNKEAEVMLDDLLIKANDTLYIAPRSATIELSDNPRKIPYLNILQTEFSLRFKQGNMNKAGDTMHTMLNEYGSCSNFWSAGFSFICAADFYAANGLKCDAEHQLDRLERAAAQRNIHWFEYDIKRIRKLVRGLRPDQSDHGW
ncbi:MAG: hypothetical protein EPO21_01545 [Chloroflexota bacterium]|nr:MAG: hypothetical protein EPO21_01545 [Chloroflexota bacterium]